MSSENSRSENDIRCGVRRGGGIMDDESLFASDDMIDAERAMSWSLCKSMAAPSGICGGMGDVLLSDAG